MKLRSITIGGFRNLKKTTINFDGLTTLIALNSYGKSNVLRGIEFAVNFYKASPALRQKYFKLESALPLNQATCYDDFYFEINGKKTTIKLPDTYNYKDRNVDHIYNADGTISSQPDITYAWAKFENRTPESFFNSQGFVATVIDGMYYMAPTWWSYGQVIEGRICSFGGNMNSIGIETCVNEGSDLWLTWQITGQLIAKLMYDNNLTIDRVKGHHFFDGKDCPQPLLENDMAIWHEIIKCIEAEYELITTYKDVKFDMVSNNTDIVDANGRVVSAPTYTQCVSYTVTITNGDKVETITLGSIIPGIYEK